MLTSALITPHAPQMIPSVARRLKPEVQDVAKMQQTLDEVLGAILDISKTDPHTVIIMSQRATIIPDAISVHMPVEEEFFGSMADFGEEDCVSIKSHNDLAMRIFTKAQESGLKVITQENNVLDFGSLIPLYYLQKAAGKKFNVVVLSMSLESKKAHFEFGKFLYEALKEVSENITFIASAELSQTCGEHAPGGFNPLAEEFDEHVKTYVSKRKVENFLLLDPFDEDEFLCHGLRPIAVALGIAEASDLSQSHISYDAPYGVGYLTALYK